MRFVILRSFLRLVDKCYRGVSVVFTVIVKVQLGVLTTDETSRVGDGQLHA
jgi:hypothetical protein